MREGGQRLSTGLDVQGVATSARIGRRVKRRKGGSGSSRGRMKTIWIGMIGAGLAEGVDRRGWSGGWSRLRVAMTAVILSDQPICERTAATGHYPRRAPVAPCWPREPDAGWLMEYWDGAERRGDGAVDSVGSAPDGRRASTRSYLWARGKKQSGITAARVCDIVMPAVPAHHAPRQYRWAARVGGGAGRSDREIQC